MKVDATPFRFGGIVSQQAFTNREKEIEKLRNNLTQGIHTILISPRRWGKSSLVEKVVNSITDKTVRTVTIDLNQTSSEEEFLELFAKEIIKASSNKMEDLVTAGQQFFKQLLPKINFGPTPDMDFSLSFDWEALKQHPNEILNLPQVIAQKKNLRFIICIDEFQNMADFKGYRNLEKKMRALWQRQSKVTYCLYGSKSHMMRDIFDHVSNPFYRFGDMIHLPKIKTEKWVHFITKSFRSTNKTISPIHAKYIAETMGNHSWYVQQLAHYTWQNTKKEVGPKQLNTALDELMAANLPFLMQLADGQTPSRLNFLKAIAHGETKYYAEKTKRQYRLGTPNLIKKNKATLEKEGMITKTEKGHEFLDPVFELWFKKTYLKKPYPKLS